MTLSLIFEWNYRSRFSCRVLDIFVPRVVDFLFWKYSSQGDDDLERAILETYDQKKMIIYRRIQIHREQNLVEIHSEPMIYARQFDKNLFWI